MEKKEIFYQYLGGINIKNEQYHKLYFKIPKDKTVYLKLTQKIVSSGEFCVVSGAALGCDITAHSGAFPNTIAVFGNGLEQIYPKANEMMINQIYKKFDVSI